MIRQEALQLIMDCLSSLNRERGPHRQIPLSETTALLAESSDLDSLAFVSFITDLEDRMRSKTTKDLALVEVALRSDDHPLRNVAKLADYIAGETEK